MDAFTKEFLNTDAELARCIKSRMRQELDNITLTNPDAIRADIRNYMIELCTEIINEDF